MAAPGAPRTTLLSAALLVAAGCLGYGDIDDPNVRTALSQLPAYEGHNDSYRVLLVHAGAPPSADGEASCASQPFFDYPAVTTPSPYFAGTACGPPIGDLSTGRLFLNRSDFRSVHPDVVILQGGKGTFVCCLGAAHRGADEPYRTRLNGRNVTVALSGAAFHITVEGFEPRTLGPRNVLEFDTFAPDGSTYTIRFDHPGTWDREAVHDPRDEWSACEPPYHAYLCHASWRGSPTEEARVRWRWARPDYQGIDFACQCGPPTMRLNQSKARLSDFLEPLIQLPGWNDVELLDGSIEVSSGNPKSTHLNLQNSTHRMEVRSWGGRTDGRVTTENRSAVRVVSHVRLANATSAFDDLTIANILSMAGLGSDVSISFHESGKYAYDWAAQAAYRRVDGSGNSLNAWVRGAEPNEGVAWRPVYGSGQREDGPPMITWILVSGPGNTRPLYANEPIPSAA